MNHKPEICPICGAFWLADTGEGLRLECLDCGAIMQQLGSQWFAVTIQAADKNAGPVCLTRNRHMWSKEGLDRPADELGYPPETP